DGQLAGGRDVEVVGGAYRDAELAHQWDEGAPRVADLLDGEEVRMSMEQLLDAVLADVVAAEWYRLEGADRFLADELRAPGRSLSHTSSAARLATVPRLRRYSRPGVPGRRRPCPSRIGRCRR